MRPSVFDFIDNLDTLLAVIIGAVLATGGAMVAELVQDRLGRKRKARDAARFFGEILTSVDRVLDRAISSLKYGDRFGSVSKRLFRTASEETSVYERNRERMFDIHDIELRRLIHTHFLEETVPLVAMLEYWDEVDAVEKELAEDDEMSEARRVAKLNELEQLKDRREVALQSVVEQRKQTKMICDLLEPIADLKF